MRKALYFLLSLFLLVRVPADATTAPPPTPLSLQDAVRIALQNNVDYRSAVVSVRVAVDELRSARSGLGPSLTLQDQYQYQSPVAQLSTPFGALPFTPNSTNVPILTAAYPLLNAGTAARIEMAYANASAAQAQEGEARSQVIAQVSRAYYDLVAAVQSTSVAAYGVQLARQHLRDTQERYAAEQVPRAEVLQSQTDLAQRQLDLIEERNNEALALNKLDAAMNVPLSSTYAAGGFLPALPPDMPLNSLIAHGLLARGELVAAEEAVTAARYAVRNASSARVPRVALAASEGNVQPPVSPGFHAQFTVALSAVWRILDAGEAAARTDEALAQVDQAQLALERARTSVELDIRTGYLDAISARERVSAAQHAVILADENQRLASVRYRGGVGTSLELRDAELRDISARQQLLSARTALAKSLVDLRLAAGLL